MPSRIKLTKNPVFLQYFSKFMGILLFVLKYIFISLLLKMINGFSWSANIMASPLKKKFVENTGADPGYVKRGVPRSKRGGGGWYNPKIAQKWPKIGWICMIYLSKGGACADSDHTWIRPWNSCIFRDSLWNDDRLIRVAHSHRPLYYVSPLYPPWNFHSFSPKAFYKRNCHLILAPTCQCCHLNAV